MRILLPGVWAKCGLAFIWLWAGLAEASGKLLAFVPASMTNVMPQLATDFTNETGIELNLSFAGTAQLARQLEAGAPADIFISADLAWINWLEERQLVSADSRQAFAGNELVIAVRNEVENWADAKALVTRSRFAMAEPVAIPAGRYGKQALQHLGWWEAAQKQAVYGENVRVTLRQLALGEVAAAIVYGSDVLVEPRTKIAWRFPSESHSPIRYFVSVTPQAKLEANQFIAFLLTPKAQQILTGAGFSASQQK